MGPSACLHLHHRTSVVRWLGNARHPLTRLLPHFPQALWNWVSHTDFSFFLHIQCHEVAILAVNVDDIRILKAGGPFRDQPIHQQPGLRLQATPLLSQAHKQAVLFK